MFGGGAPFGGGAAGMLCGALGPVFTDGICGRSIDGVDDIDDPKSLGPDGDGGEGSLGDIRNGPETGSGNTSAFAIGGPNRMRFTSMPVAIAALRIRCFVVMV